MNFSEAFIRRPVMTTLVMAAIVIFGWAAYSQLPINDLPNVDFPTISVSAGLPGASPETMASAVAMPLERQFSTIAGVDSMSSTSSLGSTNVTLQFNLSRDIDAAAQDVQAMIAKAQRDMPRDMPTPPSFQKVNPADSPVLLLAIRSDTLPLSTVNEYAETMIGQRLSMVSGVAQVNVYGSQKYAVRAQLDPRALAARQIGINEVTQAIQSANVNMPTGVLQGARQNLTVQASGQLREAAAYRPLVVAYRNGSPVRLEQLGRVYDSVENDKQAAWFNGTRSMVLAIQRQPGTNTVEVVDSIKDLLPRFRDQLPPSVDLEVLIDRSTSIRESVDDVKFTLKLTIFLVIMVIFLFLRNVSATIIPSLALPMSLIGTFAVMWQLGYSLNNLSLMALTLCVGFVVDDAIVMLENIVRHMEHGESPMQAALRGSREIGFTILSMTLSLAAVFIPVLFMGGIVGRLLHEFAVTIAVAILISGFVSLTLTPMLASRFLRPSRESHHGKLYEISERMFDGLRDAYDWSLRRVLRHRLATIMVSFAILIATVQLFRTIPKGFLPNEDTGQFFMPTEAAQGISFDEMVKHQQKIAEIFAKDPAVDAFMSSVGQGPGGSGGNNGRIFARLKPRKERDSAEVVIARLRPKLAAIPGIISYPQVRPPINVGGMSSRSQYQFTLQAPDSAELFESAPKLEQKMREIAEIQDVSSDLQLKNPQVDIDIDRDKASSLGLSVQQIEDALYTAYGSRQVTTIYAPEDAYRVIMEVDRRYQDDPTSMALLYVRSNTGKLIPLDAVAKVKRSFGPLTVNHLGQLPAVTISFNLKPGVSLSQAMERVNEAARQTLPETVVTSFQGTAQAFETSMRGLGLLLLLSIIVIYIVLGILYESFIHPITILSGLPSAGFGALVTLLLFGMLPQPVGILGELNLYAFVGIIMLVGIVKKNAIMMIDFAIAGQKEGKTPEEAIYEGCLVRFRPIMMTTMSALMGTLPIAIGLGAGSESRRPLGLAVVGGLLFSQVLTLYLTPVVYLYMERFQQWIRGGFRRRRRAEQSEMEPASLVHTD